MTPTGDGPSPLADELRAADYDRWLTTLFAHPADRPALVALYAFNHEAAKTRERVSEPMAGEIRLQWWRETIEGLYAGAVRRHPVAEALAPVVRERALPQAELLEILAARDADLYDDSTKSFDELLAYADGSAGALAVLAMRVCGAQAADALAAARLLGRGWALTGLLRALAFQAAMGRTSLPRAELEAAGIAPETLFAGRFPEAAKPLARRMAETARASIAESRQRSGAIGRRALSPMLLAPLAEDYLARFDRAGGDPFAADFSSGALGRQIRLAWAAARRRY